MANSGAVQAAIREKSRQDREVDRENFYSALNRRSGGFPKSGLVLPRPTRWDGGGRVWVFSSK